MTWTTRLTALGCTATLTAGAFVVSAVPAQAATAGTCRVSVTMWSDNWNELVSDATAVCHGARAVKVRSRLYSCNWAAGSNRNYGAGSSSVNRGSCCRGDYRVNCPTRSRR